jgi:hypothetical protein
MPVTMPKSLECTDETQCTDLSTLNQLYTDTASQQACITRELIFAFIYQYNNQYFTRYHHVYPNTKIRYWKSDRSPAILCYISHYVVITQKIIATIFN